MTSPCLRDIATLLCATLFFTLSSACQQTPSSDEPHATSAPTVAPVVPSEPAEPAASQPATPSQQLDAMDPRTPVPLQPMMAWHQKQNMQKHLEAVAQITDALSREDWDGVERAASTIGSSPSMQQMCEHMGAGAPGFTELAMTFHTRADGIAEAAKERDVKKTLSATSHTLQACTSCHAAYKQHIVDADIWQKLTRSTHEPPH